MNLDLIQFTLEIIYLIKKEGAYVKHLDDYSDNETHWVALYALNINLTYSDIFGIKHMPKEIKIVIDKSLVVTNIFMIQQCVGIVA